MSIIIYQDQISLHLLVILNKIKILLVKMLLENAIYFIKIRY